MRVLKGDCDACIGLCCMTFPFDRGEDFAIDKPAGVACPHLGEDDRCSVHAARETLGFHGCIGFDCLGAGQRIAHEVFPGQHWRDSPELIPRMIEAFRALRAVHAALELVEAAGHLPLGDEAASERAALLQLLDPEGGWTETELAGFAVGPLPKRVAAFLSGLRGVVSTA